MFDGKETAEYRLFRGYDHPLYSGTPLPFHTCALPHCTPSVPVAQYPVKALLSYPDSNVPAWCPPARKRHTAENKAKRKLKELEADARVLNLMREMGTIYGSMTGLYVHTSHH